MKNKDSTETPSTIEDFKALLGKALTRESDPSKVKIKIRSFIHKKIIRKNFSRFCIGLDKSLD